MSQKTEVIVHLIDDMDGSAADSTYLFGWEGKQYEIDLTKKNGAPLEKVMASLVPHARLVRSSPKTGRRMIPVATGPDPRSVRRWCQANGIEVNRMGKIPQEVIEQYVAAGN